MSPMMLYQVFSLWLAVLGLKIRETYKLFSQFEHVDNATPLALSEDGKISLGSAHGTGPQLDPVSD